MIVLDVNVLVAAHRLDHDYADIVNPWFDELVASEPFAVPNMVWGSFLRLVTNRRVFGVPTSLVDAFAFIEAVVAQSHWVTAEPGPDHLSHLRHLCEAGDAAGDLLPDAVLAAIAREHGATIATFDRDFARFDGVATIRPGA